MENKLLEDSDGVIVERDFVRRGNPYRIRV